MSELIRFGPGDALVGILSGPAGKSAAPVLILPNAGLVPRAGPFRLHVELAARLEPRGIRTFRFDLPGIGEAPRVGGCDGTDAIIAAIDYLSAHRGATTFAVGGICSAADVGWRVAVRDPRVSGMLMLDGLSFRGVWFRTALIMGVLKRGPRAWGGIFKRLLARRSNPPVAGGGPTDLRDWPDPASVRQDFKEMLARDTRSLWIYSGGYSDLFLHPRQFAAMLGQGARDPRVAMHYWPDCDHTFYARKHRDRLLDTIETWMATQWGAVPTTA